VNRGRNFVRVIDLTHLHRVLSTIAIMELVCYGIECDGCKRKRAHKLDESILAKCLQGRVDIAQDELLPRSQEHAREKLGRIQSSLSEPRALC
jgi:hypothetical protein